MNLIKVRPVNPKQQRKSHSDSVFLHSREERRVRFGDTSVGDHSMWKCPQLRTWQRFGKNKEGFSCVSPRCLVKHPYSFEESVFFACNSSPFPLLYMNITSQYTTDTVLSTVRYLLMYVQTDEIVCKCPCWYCVMTRTKAEMIQETLEIRRANWANYCKFPITHKNKQ